MRGFCGKTAYCNSMRKAIIGLPFVLFVPFFCIGAEDPSPLQNPVIQDTQKHTQTNKIKVKTPPPPPEELSLDEKIIKESANPSMIDNLNFTLFDTNTKYLKSSSLLWLSNPDIKKKRSKIAGSKSSTFEIWWKLGLDGSILEDRLNYSEVIRTRSSAKVLTQLADSLFARAELELVTGSGSVQQIYQRLGETDGVTQREIMISWRPVRWMTVQFGAINQSFLQSPLLLADIPFPSMVENVELFKGVENDISLSFQQAIPTTFSDSHSIYTQSLSKTPLLITKSLFWNYDPKSYYKIKFSSTFFHYNPLPSDIALISRLYGNTVVEEPSRFKYRYTGLYFGIEPLFRIFPNLGLQLKLHYINNISNTIEVSWLNKGLLASVQAPFDITENIRITPVLEYFVNQPDSAVGYYNSERYGHSDRTGFVIEGIINFYEKNMEVGFRHLRSWPVRERGGLRKGQIYYLAFLRTNYAKI